ncbi:MAG: excinuclease ABC subunit C [Saprospiraceae bacterium]|nr:excinuclease ABC subunit C [Saprospiraceae bacterium]
MNREDFHKVADKIPKMPGIYKYLDADNNILYVGKAKNLKNRVSSYFSAPNGQNHKTKVMLKAAQSIEFFVVNSEADALLLESTLIKKYQPRYNIMLKDGKSYVYICIKKEPFPRVFITRRVIKDGSSYFGPYTSKFRIEQVLEVIKKLFKLRTCNFNLSPENIAKGKIKLCLEYHIKNCEGPCQKLESEENYLQKIESIKHILKGQTAKVKESLRENMFLMAELNKFEEAQIIKENIEFLDDYQGKSTVVSTSIEDLDVFAIREDEDEAFVQYIKIINGAIIHTFTQEFEKNLEVEQDSILNYAIEVIREKFNSLAEEIIVPFDIPSKDPNVRMVVPKIGDKKKLLELAEKNLFYYCAQKKRDEANKVKKQSSEERILNTLKSDLNMAHLPMHIECFDNSNIQGAFPVSSCVVFKNGKPAKKDYRYFNIKTVIGPNDFASMEEVVYRRYSRVLKEGKPLADLIIIDGGKGQLSSAYKILESLGLQDKVVVIGIAKQLEEIFFPNDPIPIYINKKSESLKLIQQVRNEAHRFAITFHRNQRSKDFTKSSLFEIEGIGKKTVEKILSEFKSIENLKNTSPDILEKSLGKAITQKILEYYK